MKRSIAFVAILAMVGAAAVAAPSKPSFAKAKVPSGSSGYALGIFLGQPTGLTARIGLGNDQSIEAKAAWNFGAGGAIHLEANYDFEFPGTLVIEGEDFIPYFGAGAYLELATSDLGLGVHVPVGLTYRFAKVPMELALEINLGMAILPATELSYGGGLAARWRLPAKK